MVIADAKSSAIPLGFSAVYRHISWKKLGATNPNALLDSMRASSPTRTPSQSQDQASWILQHPSALNMLEEMGNGWKGKQIVVFLDYDGTLSPIVPDPDRAFITNDMRQAVRDAAHFFPTAIVTGRSRAKVYDFVRLSELYYAGSHGMDIKGPSKQTKLGNQTLLCQPATEFLPIIHEVYTAMIEKVKNIPGAMVENNRFCLSKWTELADQVKLVMKEYSQLRLTHGRKVFDIRPTIKWDKGNAVEFLLESLGYAESNDVMPIYIGDDRTDEDAFRVLRERGQGLGILVSKSPKETNASYSLQGPTEVMHFLRRLVEWKKLSLPRH